MARAVLHGIPVSAGIAIGKSFFLNHRHKGLRHDLVPLDQVEAEAARLEAAVDAVAAEFEEASAAALLAAPGAAYAADTADTAQAVDTAANFRQRDNGQHRQTHGSNQETKRGGPDVFTRL